MWLQEQEEFVVIQVRAESIWLVLKWKVQVLPAERLPLLSASSL